MGSLVPIIVGKWFLIITITPGGTQTNPFFSKLSFATSESKNKDLTTKTTIFFSFLQISTCGNTLQAKDRVFKGPRSQKDQKRSQKTIAEEKKQ